MSILVSEYIHQSIHYMPNHIDCPLFRPYIIIHIIAISHQSGPRTTIRPSRLSESPIYPIAMSVLHTFQPSIYLSTIYLPIPSYPQNTRTASFTSTATPPHPPRHLFAQCVYRISEIDFSPRLIHYSSWIINLFLLFWRTPHTWFAITYR